MTNPTHVDIAGGTTDKGPVRKANEDAFILPDEKAPLHLGHIYIVADGVGGQEHGAEASQLAVRIIHDVFYQTRQVGESVPVALEHAADQANLAIYEQAESRGVARMGCTVVAVVHHENQRTILHAGDARAYLLRGGELQQLTRDDTWVQRQVDEGIFGEDTAANHELRHVVTRVLGNKPDLQITLSPAAPIEAGDILLLCSDGLYDVVAAETIQNILSGYSAQAATETLVNQAVKVKAKDNITAVVINSQPEEVTQGQTAPIPTVIRPPQPQTMIDTPTNIAGPQQKRGGLRLPLWALGTILLAIILSVLWGASALWRQIRPPVAPIATATIMVIDPAEAEVLNPTDTAPSPTPTTPPLPTSTPLPPTVTPETATSTTLSAGVADPTTSPQPTDTLEPTVEIVSDMACIVSPGGIVFVWQDEQIVGGNCDQHAQEGFVLVDGDQVIITDPTPLGVLGPDSSCLENEFIKVQSAADAGIEGWVLVNNVITTTVEQGCPP